VRIPVVGEINNLVSDIKNLRQGAVATLYEAYSAALYRAIARTIKNESDAQDALQNTFIKIWRNLDSYNAEKGTLFTWMLSIAQHEAVDMVRSKHHKQCLVTGSLNDVQIAERKNPFIHLDTMDLHKLLSVLRPMDRAIFELIYFRGYSCEQAAAILGIPCGTIKTKLQSGYKKLRTALSESMI
jgi:RNA polymerase sigma-70 factor (ECF subfamily)